MRLKVEVYREGQFGNFDEPNPPLSYDIAAQASAIREAQKDGRLQVVGLNYFNSVLRLRGIGVGIIQINTNQGVLVEFDGTNDQFGTPVFSRLKHGDPITIVATTEPKPEVMEGRPYHLLAAVIAEGDQQLYTSPGFDLDAFAKSQQKNRRVRSTSEIMTDHSCAPRGDRGISLY